MVRLFPRESCSCPSSGTCYHILAVKISIGSETNLMKHRTVNLNMLRKRTRARKDKTLGRKMSRKTDTDDNPAKRCKKGSLDASFDQNQAQNDKNKMSKRKKNSKKTTCRKQHQKHGSTPDTSLDNSTRLRFINAFKKSKKIMKGQNAQTDIPSPGLQPPSPGSQPPSPSSHPPSPGSQPSSPSSQPPSHGSQPPSPGSQPPSPSSQPPSPGLQPPSPSSQAPSPGSQPPSPGSQPPSPGPLVPYTSSDESQGCSDQLFGPRCSTPSKAMVATSALHFPQSYTNQPFLTNPVSNHPPKCLVQPHHFPQLPSALPKSEHQPHLQPLATPLSLIARQTMQQKSSCFIIGKPKQKKQKDLKSSWLTHIVPRKILQQPRSTGSKNMDSRRTTRKF